MLGEDKALVIAGCVQPQPHLKNGFPEPPPSLAHILPGWWRGCRMKRKDEPHLTVGPGSLTM